MFSRQVELEIAAAARAIAVEPAVLLAVAEVESGGRAFTVIDGRREPLIRFEGHYFDRRLTPQDQALARAAGLAAPAPGAVVNPPGQAARWAMLTRAAAIDRKAAYESTSWGIGQVMGAHWAWLGYPHVNALVAEARSGVAGQARLMIRYIEKAGLAETLHAHDWAAFARGYNGPGYKANRYDIRLRNAYLRRSGGAYGGETAIALRRGGRGGAIRELQQRLATLGYSLAADGIFGPVTERIVKDFQARHGLAPDGVVGPLTRAALAREAAPHRWWARLMGWIRRLVTP